MGNSNRKQTKQQPTDTNSTSSKQPKKSKKQLKATSDPKIVSMPIKTEYSDSLDSIYTSVVTAFIDKRSVLPCIFMKRNNNIHITTRILKSEKITDESLAELTERLEDYFNQFEIQHNIYTKSEDYDMASNTIKLYLHLNNVAV